MHLHAVGFQAPVEGFSVAPGDIQIGMDGFLLAKELAHQRHRPLDLGFVFRVIRSGWIDEAAVVIGHFLIGVVDLWEIQIWLEDARFQVVDDQTLRYPFKELEHAHMRADKASLILFVNKLDKLQATVRQRGDKGIHVAVSPGERIEQSSHFAIVDLHFFTRRRFEPAGGRTFVSKFRHMLLHETPEGRVAGGKAVPLADDFVSRFWLKGIVFLGN